MQAVRITKYRWTSPVVGCEASGRGDQELLVKVELLTVIARDNQSDWGVAMSHRGVAMSHSSNESAVQSINECG